jgi:UDP-hydrolysing UDP-N-acetyl-D-glucosamine 2-epimerase
MELMNRSRLEEDLSLPSECAFFLVTYHPETMSSRDPGGEVEEMLAALDQFPTIRVLLTGVNADPGHNTIAHLIKNYSKQHKKRVSLYQSLGQLRYLSAMKYAAAVIGNSSSGIIEAPAMGVPTINIGRRQHGRLRAPSIIDCPGQTIDISAAIRQAMNPDFRKNLKDMSVPYGTGGASKSIKNHLKKADLASLAHKKFHDIRFESAPV